MGMKGMLGEGN